MNEMNKEMRQMRLMPSMVADDLSRIDIQDEELNNEELQFDEKNALSSTKPMLGMNNISADVKCSVVIRRRKFQIAS